MGRQKATNAHLATVRKATEALRGKKSKVGTTTTGGGQDVQTPGKIVTWPEIQKIHEEHDRTPGGGQ